LGLRFTVHLDYSPTYTFGSLSPQCNYYQIPTPFCRFIPRAYPPLLILPMILGSIRSFSVRRQYLSENASQRANFVPLIDDVSPIFRSRGFTYHIGPDGRDFRDPSHRISSCASSHSIVHLPYITAAYVVHRRRRSRGGQVSTFQFAVAHCARFGGET
jgi:hypothetical protein